MATYDVKYRAEWQNYRGHIYRLDVEQRDDGSADPSELTPAPQVVEMGGLSGCVLDIQGGQHDIISPIIKTQLRFTLVDAPEESTATVKMGDWQEFYTPDATLYSVTLYRKAGDSYIACWRGYITPDSWEESLDFRGTITVTARDNLGHLQDFDFDMDGNSDGLVRITDIFSEAATKIGLPMSFSVDYTHFLEADGLVLDYAYVNVSLFDGMNWYDVLERTLEAAGLAIRFSDGVTLTISSIRDLSRVGNESGYNPLIEEIEFYGGTLELDPAVKQIREMNDYGFEAEIDIETAKGLTYSGSYTYQCAVYGVTLNGGGVYNLVEHSAPYTLMNSQGNTAWESGSWFLNPDEYTALNTTLRVEGESWKNYIFLPANRVTSTTVAQSLAFNTRVSSGIKLRLTFANPVSISSNKIGVRYGCYIDTIEYEIRFNLGSGTYKYWSGYGWSNTSRRLTANLDAQAQYDGQSAIKEFVVSLNGDDLGSAGTLELLIYNIVYKQEYNGGETGLYARLSGASVEYTGATAIGENTVTTINNEAYNVKIEREPIFGALSTTAGFIQPANYKAALFYYPTGETVPALYPYNVIWQGEDAETAVPLPVAIHQQILCYYFGAARVLSGNCAPENNGKVFFNRRFSYKGVLYILQGGAYDLFSGIINGAVLREFADFDDLWEDVPTYEQNTTYKQ